MKHPGLKTVLSQLAICIAAGLTSQAYAQSIPLKPTADNEIFFNNFENIFDASGNFKGVGALLAVGDHLAGIINIQNIDADGTTLFFSSATNQLTGFFAQEVVAIDVPDPFNPTQTTPHITFGPPKVTVFCKATDCINSPLQGDEVMRLYHDTGATAFKSSGPMASDVATATDGTLWLSLTNKQVDGDAGYFYSHVDGFAATENQEDRAYAGLNAVINGTGFEFFKINDLNEIEIGDSPPGTPLLFNDIVMTSELESNPNLPPSGTSPWEIRSNDPATIRPFELVGGACRFTGGGVDTTSFLVGDLFIQTDVWDGTLESGSSKFVTQKRVKGKLVSETLENRYTFGGQAGANTGAQPQPKGEWTHHQMTGPAGDFVFHAGTASAPLGTEIDAIRCSDDGFCSPARPAPTKQLDFDCVGTFRTIGKGPSTPVWRDENNVVVTANATSEGNGNKTFDGTYHWCEVNIDDLGEPGNENSGQNLDPATNPAACPPNGFGEKGDTALANCDCPDFYRITIYDGVDAANVVRNPDGSIDTSSLNKTDVIYQVKGYINGGNLQIHPPTGFDLK